MYTDYEKNKGFSRQIIGAAIRAIENQAERGRSKQSPERHTKQQHFFVLLNQLADKIFAGIVSRAERNERSFYLTSLPGFRERCDQIFGQGFGDFPSEMVNRWLYAHDLKHLIHCNGNTLVW